MVQGNLTYVSSGWSCVILGEGVMWPCVSSPTRLAPTCPHGGGHEWYQQELSKPLLTSDLLKPDLVKASQYLSPHSKGREMESPLDGRCCKVTL